MKKLYTLLIFCLTCGFIAKSQTPGPGNILYVNASVSGGTGSGNSWENAIPQLADALKFARSVSWPWVPLKIYVARGIYKPKYNAADGSYTTDGSRDNAFVMVKNVQLYGGFNPALGIVDLTQKRDYTSTILSGDIGVPVINTDNSYHVIISSGAIDSAVLDGFLVKEAYSTISDAGSITVNGNSIARNTGGGMYNSTSSPAVGNCIFESNRAVWGGGMSNYSSSPSITNCNFIANTATTGGGGMENTSSSPQITGSNFINNNAHSGGAGMSNSSYSSPVITNSTFKNNHAYYYGGGMLNSFYCSPTISNTRFTKNRALFGYGAGMDNRNFSSPVITGCDFTENVASDYGGGMRNVSSSSPTITNTTIANNGDKGFYVGDATSIPVFHNSIVWDIIEVSSGSTYTANYSLLKGLHPPGTGNLNAVSLVEGDVFANYTGGDYTLKEASPAINAGNNTLFTSLGTATLDLEGNQRVLNGTIDLGAYEYYIITPDANNIIYVNASVSGGDGTGTSWANAITQLADVLKYARKQYDSDNEIYSVTPLKIYVAGGTYKPLYNAADGYYTKTGAATNDYTDRDNAFVMVQNVQIYGGFDPVGGIDDLTDKRDYTNTILSGDIGTVGTATDNVYHVLISAGAVGSALIDGFKVTGGYSNSSNSASIVVNSVYIQKYYGGGINIDSHSLPAIRNCSFTENTSCHGGGMSNDESSPEITNCSFTGNTASNSGGGIYNHASSPTITNCIFTENRAIDNGDGIYGVIKRGGGICNLYTSSPTIINCTFKGNTASNVGGGIDINSYSSPTITNCSITGNSADVLGGGMSINESSSPIITNTTVADNGSDGLFINNGANAVFQNTIIWDNIYIVAGGYAASYSLLKDLNPAGTGNINAASLVADDVFADFMGGNYNLKETSPAVDAGSNALFTGLVTGTLDLEGNTRVYNSVIDLGAFELQSGTLPVRLISFTARKENNIALLQWTTAIEQNNSAFGIERSADGKNWKQISFVNSLATEGNGTEQLNYNFVDKNPLTGKNYYRLKQIDVDDKYQYSTVRVVSFDNGRDITIYPNPATELLNIKGLDAGESVVMYDITGKILKGQKSKGDDMLFPIHDVSAGVYQVVIISEAHVRASIKVVKLP